MNIRLAKAEDAEPALALVRRSIIELCKEDHQGDRLTLEGWLANKSLKNMETWITRPGSVVVLAEREGRLAGVGAFTAAGDVILLYVAPEDRFQGVSKALLAECEKRAKEMRVPRLCLTSSITAQRFFLDRGYQIEEQAADIFDSDQGLDFRKELA
jgi:N-acetylglutamate synthase-like GNAT family acetyltransferase